MNAAPALLGYAAAVGFLAPRLLLRSAWPQRAPTLAVAVWLALSASFTMAIALATYQLIAPTEHLHVGLTGLLHSCGLTTATAVSGPTIASHLEVALPGSVVLVVLGGLAFEVLRGLRARSRHRKILDVVGRRSPRLRATVLEHDLPAAYCLPGRRPRVVVSAGAVRLLSTEQLDAVLEHERAHITGRHHLALAASAAFARIFGRLPLARHAREQTAVLLEMIADDRALRHQPREVLAAAMYEMAAGTAPVGAFSVGGPTALIRLRRILTPQQRPHAALRGSVAAAAATVPLVPLLMSCAHAIG
ncbi:M56 family metallopeptidase [Streptomyces sp. NPDC086554]|uniref:M56 family metallopeptidase n=1 Tax=Streptomyces sp. NPDC086554 TaxID=3154864 RepID=UPI0034437AED